MDVVPILATVLIQYQALAAPVLVPVQASAAGGGSPLTSGQPSIQYQAFAAPVVVPSQVVSPVTGASPVYPAQVFARRRLHAAHHLAFAIDTQWEAPAAVEVPELPPTTVDQIRRRPWHRALYTQFQPEFGVPTEVPVMAWTGHYPDTLAQFKKRAHARFMQALAWDTVLFPAVVTAPDQAVAVYPDRIDRTSKLRAYPQPSWPPFVADTTVIAPVSSWQAEHPDRLFPRRALHPSRMPFFWLHSEPVPVIAVSHVTGGRGYYVVPPRKRTFIVPPRRRKFTV
jgi:hypothetical protein